MRLFAVEVGEANGVSPVARRGQELPAELW